MCGRSSMSQQFGGARLWELVRGLGVVPEDQLGGEAQEEGDRGQACAGKQVGADLIAGVSSGSVAWT